MSAIEIAVFPGRRLVVHKIRQLCLLGCTDEVQEQGLARQGGMRGRGAERLQQGPVARRVLKQLRERARGRTCGQKARQCGVNMCLASA